MAYTKLQKKCCLADEYRKALNKDAMSNRGDCWDNAVVESFYGTWKFKSP